MSVNTDELDQAIINYEDVTKQISVVAERLSERMTVLNQNWESDSADKQSVVANIKNNTAKIANLKGSVATLKSGLTQFRDDYRRESERY